MKRIVYLIIATFVLSCSKEIDFNLEITEFPMVMNSIICPDSSFKASLTLGIPIAIYTGGNPPGIPGTIELFENNTLIDQITSQNGIFKSDKIKLKAGNQYKIVATSGGKQVTAETYIPGPPVLLSVETKEETNKNGEGFYWYFVRLKDSPGNDYYKIIGRTTNLIQFTDSKNNRYYYQYSQYFNFESNDPVVKYQYDRFGDNTLGIGQLNFSSVFNDELFQGKEYTLKLYQPLYEGAPDTMAYGGVREKIYSSVEDIIITKLSDNLYNYLKPSRDYSYLDEFSNIYPAYSNIKNGAGLFAGYSAETKYTTQKVFVPHSMDTIKLEKEYPYSIFNWD